MVIALLAAALSSPVVAASIFEQRREQAKLRCEAAASALYRSRELVKAARSLAAAAEPEDAAGREVAAQAAQKALEASVKNARRKQRDCARAKAFEEISPRFADTVIVPAFVRGLVEVETPEGWKKLDGKTPLVHGRTIRTGKDGYVEMVLDGGGEIRLGPDAAFTPQAHELNVSQGAFYYLKERVARVADGLSGKPPLVRVRGLAFAVRGTRFAGAARVDGSVSIAVLEGEVSHLDEASGVATSLTPGYRAVFRDGKLAQGPMKFSLTGPLEEWQTR